jgi:hypothetical protein
MSQRVRLEDIFPADGQVVKIGQRGHGNASSIIPYIGVDRGAKRKFPETKARTILTLQMRGHTQAQIAQMMHISHQGVSVIIQRPEYKEMRERVLRELDDEFLAMKPLAFDAIEGGLRSSDENVALKAADMWFKGAGFGSYSKTPAVDPTVTAEDVVRNLLQINVNVNVPKGRSSQVSEPPVIDNDQ